MEIVTKDGDDVLPIEPPGKGSNQSLDIPGANHFVRLPDNFYIAEFIGAEGFYYRGLTPKVALWFRITTKGYEGKLVAAYYNVHSLKCKRGLRTRQPKITVGRGQDIVHALATLFPDRYSPDNLPMAVPEEDLLGREVVIETRTSDSNHKRQKRPEAFKNSVVDSILGWADKG